MCGKAVYHLAEHIQNNTVSKHLILFGADVSLFEGAPFPDDYRRIQQDMLNMLSYMGLNAGTGMESHYGDFGRFKSKLDRHWHMQVAALRSEEGTSSGGTPSSGRIDTALQVRAQRCAHKGKQGKEGKIAFLLPGQQ